MALKNSATLTIDKNAAIVDNTSGLITPLVTRDQQQDIIDSMLNLAAGNPTQTVASPVNFTGGLQINGSSIVIVFGAEYCFSESVGNSDNSSTTPASKVQYTIPASAPTGIYYAEFSCTYNSDTNNRQAGFNIEANAVLQGGAVIDSSNTSDEPIFHRSRRISHTTGVNTLLNLLFYRGAQATTITTSQALIQVWRLS